jgi:hypothetical protein
MTTKRRKRHGPEEIVRKLRDADAMLNAGHYQPAVLARPRRRWLKNGRPQVNANVTQRCDSPLLLE